MIDAPPQPTTAQQQDANARAYIKSLLAHNPIEIEDVGKWAQICKHLGASYEGNPDNIRFVYQTLLKTQPDLKMLMQDEQQPLQGGSGPVVPELPEQARLTSNYLPHLSDNPQDDWYEQWDSRALRAVSPWLANYIAYSNRKSPEGYVDFHVASALWVLSVVAARRVHVDLAGPVFTPLAVAFVARTSLFAKTVTAMAGVKVLKQAGLAWILGDDETTPQKLLADMGGAIPDKYDSLDDVHKLLCDQRLALAGQRGWFYDEFNQLIDNMTRANSAYADFAGLFRKLDDCHDEYRYSTRAHGQEVIEKPYLALLANTTPANLRKHAARNGEFWHDGFWARFVFVTPPASAWKTKTMQRGEVIAPFTITQPLREWNDRLGVPFCQIVKNVDMKGKETGKASIEREPLPQVEIECDDDAYFAFVRYREALREMIDQNPNHDLDGSYVRLSDKALRFAALIASLENQNRITLDIWTLAQELAEMFRKNLHELYNQVTIGTLDDDPIQNTLINYFKTLQGRAVTVRELAQYAPLIVRKMKSKQIRDLLGELEKDGMIQINKEGKKETYQLVK